MNRNLKIIIDLQFGSTGKGLIAGYLAEQDQPDTIITAWSANAGHTYINSNGRKFVHTMVANGIVSRKLERLMIGPGSIINPDSLLHELETVNDIIASNKNLQVYIHRNAAVILEKHVEEESGSMTKIGSTKKGCGAAAIDRIRRNPDNNNTVGSHLSTEHPLYHHPRVHVVSPTEYRMLLMAAENIQIEGAQGFSLSMYHGFYPYCTSRDVSVSQLLADCGVPAYGYADVTVIGTARTYPIRVANRYNEEGVQVGWSGPCYPDQHELTFEDLGQDVELTTVTKLPRRIFTFSAQQIVEAVWQNDVNFVFLNFVNYCQSERELGEIVDKINQTGAAVRYIGTGPSVNDVHDVVELNTMAIKTIIKEAINAKP